MEMSAFARCDVCRKTMIDPRILECSHSFCFECLESSTVLDESPRCPTCQIAFLMPRGGIKYLKKNEFIEQLNNLKKNNINCDFCKGDQAIKFCVDCSFNYCSTCLVLHGRIPTSSNHQLKSIAGEKDKASLEDTNDPSNITCDEHSELIKLFCKDCNLVLCDQCLNHSNHCTQDISQYFETVKLEIEENLEIIGEFIQNVNTNLDDAKRNMCDNELKASILKKQIKKRGEVVKKCVDFYVSKLIKNVDGELKKHQREADDVVQELKNIKTNSDAGFKSLKEHLNNLNYKSVIERLPDFDKRNEDIPKYSKNFDVSFACESSEPQMNLDKILGSLRKAPELRQIKRYRVGRALSFASYQDNIILRHLSNDIRNLDNDFRIHIYNCISKEFKSIRNFDNVITDLLIINGMLYISGYQDFRNRLTAIKLTKVDASLKSELQVICEFHHDSHDCKLSKSCSGNIVLALRDKIIISNENGFIMKSLDLKDKFQITNALQLDEQLYVLCRQNGEICIINDSGDQIKKFTPSNERHKMLSPCLEKDDYGNIYVGGRNVLVLDHDLNFKSLEIILNANESVSKMCYDETNGILLILVNLSGNSELVKFKL